MSPRHWDDMPGTERWSTATLRYEISERKRMRRENFILVCTWVGFALLGVVVALVERM